MHHRMLAIGGICVFLTLIIIITNNPLQRIAENNSESKVSEMNDAPTQLVTCPSPKGNELASIRLEGSWVYSTTTLYDSGILYNKYDVNRGGRHYAYSQLSDEEITATLTLLSPSNLSTSDQYLGTLNGTDTRGNLNVFVQGEEPIVMMYDYTGPIHELIQRGYEIKCQP